MDRHLVANATVYPASRHPLQHAITVADSNRIDVKHVLPMGCFFGTNDQGSSRQGSIYNVEH